MKLRILGLSIVATVVGCADEPFRGPRPPRPEEIPAAVAVAGGAVELGFAIGRARTVVEVAAFEISLPLPATSRRQPRLRSISARSNSHQRLPEPKRLSTVRKSRLTSPPRARSLTPPIRISA